MVVQMIIWNLSPGCTQGFGFVFIKLHSQKPSLIDILHYTQVSINIGILSCSPFADDEC